MADARQLKKQSSSWFIQYAALTHKSWKVVWHRKLTLALLILAPSVSVIVLYVLFTLIGHSGSHVRPDDKLETLSTSLSRCIGDHRKYQLPNSSETLEQCISVGYVPDTANRARPIMEEVATSVSLNYGADIVAFSGIESMSEFMWKNPGYIDLALVFAPNNFSTYELWVNSSAVAWNDAIYGRLLTLQKSVDSAIIKQFYLQAEKQPLALDFSVQLGAFTDIRSNDKPLSEDAARVQNESRCDLADGTSTKQRVIGIVGSPLIAAGVGVSTILVLTILVSEKQKNLVGKLRQMGLKESTHIASWYSVFLLLALVSSALAVLIMKLVSHQLYAFQNTSFVVLFLTLYVFHVAMIGVAFILAAIFTKPAWIMTVSSLVFLGTLLSTLIMNSFAFNDTLDALDGSKKCFRRNNVWVLHKSKHFYEFLIFWFPWISYGQIFFDMCATTIYGTENYSFRDLGVQKTFIDTTQDQYLASPLLNSIWSMLGIWIISVVLSWYLGQALAGRTNGRRPWYFPFQGGYWGYKAPPAPYNPGDACAEEWEASKREGSLKVFKLSKSYKSGTALREVSVTMNNGEVFVLLGHNGAGKSTLINILTGLTDATYGDVYFAGYSLNSGMSQFQSVCGICPQFDALWDELNAEEHLRVCAAMQGLRGKRATEEIKGILEAVDLLGERKDRVTTFSGGMKRRLSVCMATLGDNHKVIFLDEPTTGVDTINKKRVWQLIERLKHNRVIVLTTHNMEEADALGDKIAVLHQGALKAVGSSLFLKKKFGSGYQVSLLLASAEDAPEVEAIVKRVLPGAKITQSAAGNMKVSLNHNTALAIPKLLKELKVSLPGRENAGGEACSDSVPLLKDWGISNTTLDEVFLRLSAQNNQQVNEDENAPDVDSENLCLICGLRKSEVVTLYTSTGISVKVPNAVCLTCALAAQPDGTPELHGSTTGPVQASEEASDRLSDNSAVPHKQVSVPGSLNINIENDGKHRHESTDGSGVSSRGRFSLFRSQIWAVLYKNFKLNMVQKKALLFYLLIFVLYVSLMRFLGGTGVSPATDVGRVCHERSELVDDGRCSPQLFLQSLVNSPNKVSWDVVAPQMAVNVLNATFASEISRIGVIPLVWYSTQGNLNFEFSASNDSTVQFKKVQGNDANTLFVSGQEEVKRNSTPADSIQSSCPMQRNDRQLFFISDASMANATFDSLFPTSGIALSTDASRNANSVHVSSIVRYRSSSHSYCSEKIWIRAPNLKDVSCYAYDGGASYRGLVSLYSTESRASDPIAESVAPSLAINALSNALLGTSVNDTGRSKIMTTVKSYPQLKFVSAPDSAETPFGVVILVIMGLSIFFPLYVRRLLMERESGLLQMMSIAGMQPAAYWLGNYIYDFILSVAAGSIFFIIGRIVGVHEFADASPVLCAVTIIVWAHALNGMTVFTTGLFKSVRAASLFAVIGLIISAVGSGFIELKYSESERMPPAAAIFPPLALARILYLLFSGKSSAQEELTVDIIVLVFASTALYFIGVFVNEVRASPNSWSSLFGFSRYKAQTALKVPPNHTGESPVDKKALDENDVVLEKERVKGSPSTRFAIKTENLIKVFPASRGKGVKVAVDKLTLGLEYGEIFGLLGANGAGKTTALSMLSGSLAPSEGYIEIGGKRLTGKNQISSNQLSICPQSDVVWKDLTVWTHFMFYAYLKGLSSVEARASVQVIAADLSLDGDSFHKIASSLSGGQLRRLSFGISLIGSPSILLMDEITTGLDPVSRTTIWDVVKKQSNSGRLILLTTHSMEEADTLCTRIGIMSHGRMKCLGAPLYLKNRYSNGYTLTIVTENEVQESASLTIDSLIQKAAPDATRVYTWRRVHIYSIKTFDLNYLFQLLEDNLNKYQYGIREWQIEQTTLQDVFLRVSEE